MPSGVKRLRQLIVVLEIPDVGFDGSLLRDGHYTSKWQSPVSLMNFRLSESEAVGEPYLERHGSPIDSGAEVPHPRQSVSTDEGACSFPCLKRAARHRPGYPGTISGGHTHFSIAMAFICST